MCQRRVDPDARAPSVDESSEQLLQGLNEPSVVLRECSRDPHVPGAQPRVLQRLDQFEYATDVVYRRGAQAFVIVSRNQGTGAIPGIQFE